MKRLIVALSLTTMIVLSGCNVISERLSPPTPTATPVPPTRTATPVPPTHTATPVPPTQTTTPVPPTPQAVIPPTAAAGAPGAATALPTSASGVMTAGAQDDLKSLGNLPRYTLNLTIDPTTQTYSGRQTVTYTNTSEQALADMVFRTFPNSCPIYGCGALTVTGARVGGQPVTTTAEVDGTAVRVSLPTPLAGGQRAEVALDFTGRTPRDFGPGEQGYGIHNFSSKENTLILANAYPVLAVFKDGRWQADKVYPEGDAVFSPTAFYDVSVTLPGGWTPVATGIVVADGGFDSRRTIRFTSGPVRDFILALAPTFERLQRQVGETTINSYYLGESTRAGGEKALDVAAAALEIFNRRFGPYPFTELDIVPAPLHKAAGVEYPGLLLVESEFYTKPNEPFFEEATAHEVAHQWWYSLVGNDVIKHPWLDEALTQYSTLMYYQERYGQRRFEQKLRQWERVVAELVQKGQDDVVGEGLAHFTGSERYAAVIYIKGPLFFHAVRERIGDAKFDAALQAYYKQYKYRIATPLDLLEVLEWVSGQELDDLYEKWILKRAEP